MQHNAEALLQSCTSSLMMNIRQFTDDQLQILLADDARLDSMIDSLPQIASLPSEREVKLAQSKSMAECNLSMEPRVKEAKAKLAKTYEEANKVKQEVEAMKAQLDNVAENRSLDVVSALLQAAAREAEDESEKTAEQFYGGGMEIADFVKAFEEKRMLAHKRKVKSEKLVEILRSQEYPAPNQQMPNPRIPPSSTPYPVNNVGYPSVPGHVNYPRFN